MRQKHHTHNSMPKSATCRWMCDCFVNCVTSIWESYKVYLKHNSAHSSMGDTSSFIANSTEQDVASDKPHCVILIHNHSVCPHPQIERDCFPPEINNMLRIYFHIIMAMCSSTHSINHTLLIHFVLTKELKVYQDGHYHNNICLVLCKINSALLMERLLYSPHSALIILALVTEKNSLCAHSISLIHSKFQKTFFQTQFYTEFNLEAKPMHAPLMTHFAAEIHLYY